MDRKDTWKTAFSADTKFTFRGASGLGVVPGEALVGTQIDTFGTIPESESGRLALINAKAKKKMAASDVYIHTVEALSNVYLPDRYAFFSGSTIKNVAMNADAGIAFLNSHRWDLLPLGRTFAGQYEQTIDGSGKLRERTCMGIYLPVGYEPNGDGEPGTDEIEQGIQAGTLFDVSLGMLRGAEGIMRCNVCLQEYWQCRHWRGSVDGMTLDEMVYARDVLGVPFGVCTVSLENWITNEISAVYDGAVAGAGYL